MLLHASCGTEISRVTSAFRASVDAVLPVMAMTRFFWYCMKGKRRISSSVSPLLEIIITLFAAGANIGGELCELYLRFPWWDSMLHILWGFLGAVFGYAFLKLAQKQALTPAAAVLGALGFSALNTTFATPAFVGIPLMNGSLMPNVSMLISVFCSVRPVGRPVALNVMGNCPEAV